MTGNTKLYFAGPLSLTRSPRCMLAAVLRTRTAAGEVEIPIFYQGDLVCEIGSSLFVPAWQVPTANAGNHTMDAVQSEYNVDLPSPLNWPNRCD
eukprot:9538839-Lingulodinium_polyedra.AAC.1